MEFPLFVYNINITSSQEIICSQAFIQTTDISSSIRNWCYTSSETRPRSVKFPNGVLPGIHIFWSVLCNIRKHCSKCDCCINSYVHCFLIVNPHPLCSLWVTFAIASVIMGIKVKWVKSPSHVWLFATPWTRSLPGSSLHGILQARVLEWFAISFSRGSSQPRDWTHVSRIPGRCFNLWATGEASMGIKR